MEHTKARIKELWDESIGIFQKTDAILSLETAIDAVIKCFLRGGKVITCGNGGSMEQAQHIAGELVDRFKKERNALPTITLGSNPAVLTAWANDYDYKTAFRREFEAIAEKKDCVIILSTRGNSANIIEVVKSARELGIFTIGLLGEGGELKNLVDICLAVPSQNTPRIQEVHMLFIHILCEIVEERMAHE